MKKEAIISNCGKYRHWLIRSWDDSKDMCCFIMLNPSTADADNDDPTIRRCISFSKKWGFGGFCVVNLFDLRTPKPSVLFESENPCSDRADYFIEQALNEFSQIIPAWGNHGIYQERSQEVNWMIGHSFLAEPARCLGFNKSGEPKHPLYVKLEQPLIDYTNAEY